MSVNTCEKCGAHARTRETRGYTDLKGRSYVTRRKHCPNCGWRWSTREMRVEDYKRLMDDVPPERKEEYNHLMRKLHARKAEVLAIMGLGKHHAVETGQVAKGD